MDKTTNSIQAGNIDDTTLLPCPFCGGEGEIVRDDHTEMYWQVECRKCRARTRCFQVYEQGYVMWNHRTEYIVNIVSAV